jgi:hypothetical protein
MPWVSIASGFGGQSVAGTEGDGKWTLLAGGGAAVLAFINRHAWHVKAAYVEVPAWRSWRPSGPGRTLTTITTNSAMSLGRASAGVYG